MIVYKLLSIICISILPYLLTLRGDFVFDDSEAVVKNKDVSSGSWVEPFSNDFWGTNIQSNLSHKSYRPLTILSFRLNYLLSGKKLSALHFKVTNLLCHVICCILAWQTFENILNTQNKANYKKWWTDTAYLSTLLFSVHPLHVEAVSGIVGRADILAAITFFTAFLSYNKALHNSRLKYVYLFTAIITSAVSMLFKENGVTALGFCLVYEFVKKFKRKKIINTSKLSIDNTYLDADSVFRVVLVCAAIVVLLYGRWSIMGGTTPDFKPTDNPAAFSNYIFTKMATHTYIYFLNSLLFMWPHWLCYDWSMRCVPLIENVQDYRNILVLILCLYSILILLAVTDQRNNVSLKRHIILSVSLIIIPFLPASNIFYPVGFVIAERILYIPSAGYCALVAIGFNKIIRKRKSPKKIGLLFFLLLVIYSLKSWHRSLAWQNEYSLFTSGLSVCPLNAKVHYNVAKVADASQQTEWALREYKEAIRLYPKYYQSMNNLANLLKSQKQFDEAEFYLRAAISHKREFPAAWMNLGIVLANTRRYNESHVAYKTALMYRKNYPDCYYNLGNLYLEINKTENAISNWFKAIDLNPKHILAWTNLLALLDNTGQVENALKFIPKALAELPDAASVNFAVANIYGKLDRYEDAEKHFLKAIKLFDKQVQAIHYANLGVLYHRWKKYKLAEKMYINSLKIDPQFKSAVRNLKSLQKLKT